jgi:hypothetical protein
MLAGLLNDDMWLLRARQRWVTRYSPGKPAAKTDDAMTESANAKNTAKNDRRTGLEPKRKLKAEYNISVNP